jgi:adenylylsulfate kinase-like enzyme
MTWIPVDDHVHPRAMTGEPARDDVSSVREATDLGSGVSSEGRLVLVIGGPIASGKSSLAAAAARAFERQGLSCATIDLDLIYDMLEHTGAIKNDPAVWTRARRMAGALTKTALDDGTRIVIAEGEFLEEQARREFVTMLSDRARVGFVTLTVSLSTAFDRVSRDPTRGVSRDPDFLAHHYEEIEPVLRRRPSEDLVLDTGTITLEQSVRRVLDWAVQPGV